jgi:uncharacterized protein (DUF433 family)
MKFPARIEVKSTVMLGKPCVKGTRIPVYLLLEKMAAGESFEQLLATYPQLTAEDLRACWSTRRRWRPMRLSWQRREISSR